MTIESCAKSFEQMSETRTMNVQGSGKTTSVLRVQVGVGNVSDGTEGRMMAWYRQARVAARDGIASFKQAD